MASMEPTCNPCPPSSQSQCFSQLSPCTPLTSLAQSRCSSVLATDQCSYSRLSCGSLSPISICSNTNNDVKIVITDPQNNNSVFSSVEDLSARAQEVPNPSMNLISASASILFTSLNDVLRQPWSRLLTILWAILSPALLGLFVGLTIGWTNLPGLAISIGLFFASLSLLFIILITISVWRFGVNMRRRSQYQTLPGDNTSACYGSCQGSCPSPDTGMMGLGVS